MKRFRIAVVCLLAVPALAVTVAAREYSWQRPHAKVVETGDLEWQPEPFVFEKGDSVRYIDYENGDDSNGGKTKGTPWKHHPWDKRARGNARNAEGVDTYVFKRGVIYRGSLEAYAVGEPGRPIRLTSDPDWGRGEACIYGSEVVTDWKKGADHPDIPEPQKVWYADAKVRPRCLWMVDVEGEITRIKLARTPNWEVSDPDDVLSEWWYWKNDEWWKDGLKNKNHLVKTEDGKTLFLGIDPEHMTKEPAYYQDAIVWTEWGIVMGTPYPCLVEKVLPEQHALAFNGPFYGIWGMFKGHHYFLEDKPHYLDQPGEFWFRQEGGKRRIYLRLPGDIDPNAVTIEAAARRSFIDSTGMKHVRISGLTFRFQNPWHALHAFPFGHKDAVGVGCVRVLGSADHVRIDHCKFEHVQRAIRMAVTKDAQRLDNITIADNEIRHADQSAVWLLADFPAASMGRVDFLRNRVHDITRRAQKNVHCHAVYIQMVETGEFAGNVLSRLWAGGLFLEVAKSSGDAGEVPLARVLVHHNKVIDPLLAACDWGGIELNQGGPAYIYDNVVGNPGGIHRYKLANRDPDEEPKGTPRFGHSYYIDGSFKKYLFNNIAWGKNNTPGSKYANCSALQEIIGFQNTVFNNTFFKFVQCCRRQGPEAGRNKYLGNVLDDVSQYVFRHAPEKKPDVNIQDVGKLADLDASETLAYARNVLARISGKVGMFQATGEQYDTVEGFRNALEQSQALASGLGIMASESPLRDPERHDFRPRRASEAASRGVKVFVPWGLYATVGEWGFARCNQDPTRIIDEHWFMTPYYGERKTYKDTPRYPLKGVNIGADDYVRGDLENWTHGALRLNGRDQYAMIDGEQLAQPFTIVTREVKSKGGVTTETTTKKTFQPELLRTVSIDTSNFLLEVYFRTRRDHAGGGLVSKMGLEAGYALMLNRRGGVEFAVRADGKTERVVDSTRINDGAWHHVVAEVDREAGRMTVYVDGERAAEGRCALPPDASLVNEADFVVGKSPEGDCLAGTLDFLRVARGTLADARTTIEELCAWQFVEGPFLEDFTGRRRDFEDSAAGAIDF